MRAEIYLSGVSPGPLGSHKDILLRSMLSKQKAVESRKLMALMSASFQNPETTKEHYGKFINQYWYDEDKDVGAEMMDYYENHVKHMKPVVTLSEDGTATVEGLN